MRVYAYILKQTALAGLLVLGMAMMAVAQYSVPPLVTYQGTLMESDGTPMSGAHTLTLGIYDAPTGGMCMWEGQRDVNVDADGVFTVMLSDEGDVAGHSVLETFSGPDRFMEIKVSGTSVPMAPRVRVGSAPYALQAQYAAGADSAFEVGNSVIVEGQLVVAPLGVVEVKSFDVRDLIVGDTLTVQGKTTAGKVELHMEVSNVVQADTFEGRGMIPVGGILPWTGEIGNIPTGWSLCDGQNGTPDLRNRFVVGVGGGYYPGETGGAKRVTLTVDQIPSHTHGYSYFTKDTAGYALVSDNDHLWKGGDSSQTSSTTGSGQSHENRPPFYALCFIMRTR